MSALKSRHLVKKTAAKLRSPEPGIATDLNELEGTL